MDRKLLRLASKVQQSIFKVKKQALPKNLVDAQVYMKEAARLIKTIGDLDARADRIEAVARNVRILSKMKDRMHRLADRLTKARYHLYAPEEEIITDALANNSLKEMYKEIEALDKHFILTWSGTEKWMKVTTDPITLSHKGVDYPFGPFSIRCSFLDIRKYTIEAEEPNPCCTDDTTIHPHVRNGGLCEGMSSQKQWISSLFKQGHLLDAINYLVSILSTYNPKSPYHKLEKWYGYKCTVCGEEKIPEKKYCGVCNKAPLCWTCMVTRMNDPYCVCKDCCDKCSGCQQDTYKGDLIKCKDCSNRLCKSMNCRKQLWKDGRKRTVCNTCYTGADDEQRKSPKTFTQTGSTWITFPADAGWVNTGYYTF